MLNRLCYAPRMAKQFKKKKRPTDLNLLAASIVEEATNENSTIEEPSTQEPVKNPHAVALGRLGGLKGGKARAKKLSKERLKEIAREAAKARWGDSNAS